MKTIFIHGLGQDATSWKQTIVELDNQDQLCTLDLPQLCEGSEVSYNQLYGLFSNYCNQSSDPLNLCGLSLGAILALNYAIDNPSKINSLIIIAGQVKMPKGLLKIQNVLFQCMPQSMFQSMGFSKHDFIRLTKTMMDIDFSNKLSTINIPVLILCGEKDKHNMKAAKYMAENIKESKYEIVESAGHEVNVDAPLALSKFINQFYKNLAD